MKAELQTGPILSPYRPPDKYKLQPYLPPPRA